MTPQKQIQALESLGVTRYRISCDTGINKMTLGKWLKGTDIPQKSNRNVDILNEYYQKITSVKP